MSEAYKKFLAAAPAAQRVYRTLEIYHPDSSAPRRYISDYVDKSLTLESAAPRNAGESVLFTAISMEIVEPNENQDGEAVLNVDLGAVGNEVQDALDEITPSGKFKPIECIYRKYYSGDILIPVIVLNLSISKLKFEGYKAVGFIAEDIDLSNKASGEIYTLERFPMLKGV